MVAGAGLGGGVLPLATGYVLDRRGLDWLGPFLFGGAALLALLHLVAARTAAAPTLVDL